MAAEMIAEWLVDYACHRRMTAAIHVFTYDEMKKLSLQQLIDGPSGLSSVSVRFMLVTIDTIMKQDDVKEYDIALRLIDILFSATGERIPFKVYAKSITGLKILVLFEMLGAGDKYVLAKLNEYFPASGYSHSLAPEKTRKTMTEAQSMFRNFFIPMITDKAGREKYFATNMKEDFGPKFFSVLKKHIEDFTRRVENMLPKTTITKLLAQPEVLKKLQADSAQLVKEFASVLEGKVTLSEEDVLKIAHSIKMYSTNNSKPQPCTEDNLVAENVIVEPEKPSSCNNEVSVSSATDRVPCSSSSEGNSLPKDSCDKESSETGPNVGSDDLFTDSSGTKSSITSPPKSGTEDRANNSLERNSEKETESKANHDQESIDNDANFADEYNLDDITESSELQSYVSGGKGQKEDMLRMKVTSVVSMLPSNEARSGEAASNKKNKDITQTIPPEKSRPNILPTLSESLFQSRHSNDEEESKKKWDGKRALPTPFEVESPKKKMSKLSNRILSGKDSPPASERASSEDDVLSPSPQRHVPKRTSLLGFGSRQGGMRRDVTLPIAVEVPPLEEGPGFTHIGEAQPSGVTSPRSGTPDSSQDDFYSINQDRSMQLASSQGSDAEFHTPDASPIGSHGSLSIGRMSQDEQMGTVSRKGGSYSLSPVIVPNSFSTDDSCSFDGPLEQPVKHSLSKMKQPPLLRMKPCVVKVYKSLIDYEYHDKVYPIFK